MINGKEYLTKEKYGELEKELLHLKTTRRREVAEHLEYAKSLGDLAENAEYHEAREEQANIEDRIKRLEAILASAIIMERRHSDIVGVGSSVVLRKEEESGTHTYHLVGSEETDLSQGKISLLSPLGEAMMGKKKGDTFVVKTPKGEVTYTIAALE